MNVAFNGIKEQVVTFLSENQQAGVPVCISENGTVAVCADGGQLVGVAVSAGKGINAVQMAGYVKLPYTGNAPELGFCELSGNGAGGVKVLEGGRKCLVVELDAGAGLVGLFL